PRRKKSASGRASRPARVEGKKPRRMAAPEGGYRKFFLKYLLLAAIWGSILLAAMLMFFAYDLPDTSKLGEIEKRPSVIIRSEDGLILGTYGDVYGEYLAYEDL